MIDNRFHTFLIVSRDADSKGRLDRLVAEARPGSRRFLATLDDGVVDVVRRLVPDVLVVDWSEDSVNALELSRALRCWPELAHMRVLVVCDAGEFSSEEGVSPLPGASSDREIARALLHA